MRPTPVASLIVALCVATVTAQDIDARLEQLRTDPTASFGTAPTDDFAAVPDGVLALVSWNIQTGGTAPESGRLRPPQVEKALGVFFAGSYQLLAAQEIASDRHSTKLLDQLPGPTSNWAASFTNTTSRLDNGFWFRSGTVTAREGNVILHSATFDSSGRIIVDDDLSKHPPRIAHFTVGDFDFTLISLHLTFQDGDTGASVRELENVLDFLDVYFYTPGHDPDVIITGDFNTPSRLSQAPGFDGLTIGGVIAADLRFQTGERRLVVTVHEKTSRKKNGDPNKNYDHFILSADCMEEFIQARRMNTSILLEHSDEVQPDGTRRRTSDHFPIVAFFRAQGAGVARDLP